MEPLVRPSALPRLRGDEAFTGLDATVLEFWRWALGDLRMNNARGYLAEFLVSRAVGAEASTRIEWADFDVQAGDGTRIEVKSSGYLQSWATKQLSKPTYSFKSAYSERAWDEETGAYVVVDPETRVHVWVFALQTCRDVTRYDPLDANQWEFRVIAHRRLFRTGQKSASLSFFDRHGVNAVHFEGIAEAVARARHEHEELAHARG